MAFDLVYCPVCDGADQGFTPLTFDPTTPPAVQCEGCGLGIELRLSINPAGQYARDVYDAARNAGSGGARWRRFHHDTAVAALRMTQVAAVLPPVGRWVDVGCSNGAHLALARRRGWDVMGVEADAATADEVARVLGVRTTDFRSWVVATRSEAPTAKVDVVSLFDVVEHVLDPVGLLTAAARSLAIGGVLILEVPDLGAVPPGGFPTWVHRRYLEDSTEHLWHFSARSLERLRAIHLSGLSEVRVARPVPGRLQVVWKKTSAAVPAATREDIYSLGVTVARMSEAERTQTLAAMKTHDPILHREVVQAIETMVGGPRPEPVT